MSAKCGGCGKFLSPADSAKCQACSASYHRACVNLQKTVVPPTSWRCPECTRNIVRDNNCDTPVRGRAPITTDAVEGNTHPAAVVTVQVPTELTSNIKLLNEELCAVREDLKLFRAEMAVLASSIKNCTERMDSLEARVATLERQGLEPASQISETDAIIAEFRQELNVRDQQLLLNDIEIVNLPETKGENPIHLVKQIGTKLGLTIDDCDIVSAERVGGYTLNATSAGGAERRPRPLVVRVTRRQLRDDLLRSARVRRGATTQDLDVSAPPRRFYVNERLTKYNRSLFRKAREAGHRCGWKFIWTSRGTVLARKVPGDVACTIRCEAGISRFFDTLS